ALTGVKEQQPRWKRCLQAANSLMGDAVGQAYVKETFTSAARRRALDMVENLIAALDDRLHTLEWMSDVTRAQALGKLRAFGKKRSEERRVGKECRSWWAAYRQKQQQKYCADTRSNL